MSQALIPLRVTFDTNVFERVLRLEEYSKHRQFEALQAIYSALKRGDIAGFVFEIAILLDGIQRKDRAAALSSPRLESTGPAVTRRLPGGVIENSLGWKMVADRRRDQHSQGGTRPLRLCPGGDSYRAQGWHHVTPERGRNPRPSRASGGRRPRTGRMSKPCHAYRLQARLLLHDGRGQRHARPVHPRCGAPRPGLPASTVRGSSLPRNCWSCCPSDSP